MASTKCNSLLIFMISTILIILGSTRSITMKDEICASLSVSSSNSKDTFKINISGTIVKSEWWSYKGDSNITSINVKNGCSLRICYFYLIQNNNYMGRCNHHNLLTQQIEYDQFDEYFPLWDKSHGSILSLDCSCQSQSHLNDKQNDSCIQQSCQSIPAPLEKSECGRVFREKSCRECNFESNVISVGDEPRRKNMSGVFSFLIRENCSISVTGKKIWNGVVGVEHYDHNTIPKLTENVFGTIYDVKSMDCQCDDYKKPVVPYPAIPNKPQTNSQLIVILIIIGAILCLLLTTLIIHKLTDHFRLKQQLYAALTQLDPKYHIDSIKIQHDKTLILGEGIWGQVYEGSYLIGTGERVKVAIKEIKPSSIQSTHLSSLIQEIQILGKIGRHPNIVGFFGAVNITNKASDLLLVMELCNYRSLDIFLIEHRQNIMADFSRPYMPGYLRMGFIGKNLPPINLEQLMEWEIHIISGMEHISSLNILHMDLAARNILLTLVNNKLIAKIGDFGASKDLGRDDYYMKPPTTTKHPISLHYKSPDLHLSNYKFTLKSDVYAFGVLSWEIFSLGENPMDKIHRVSKIHEKPELCPHAIYEKLEDCWNSDPLQRPKFSSLKIFFQTFLNNMRNNY